MLYDHITLADKSRPIQRQIASRDCAVVESGNAVWFVRAVVAIYHSVTSLLYSFKNSQFSQSIVGLSHFHFGQSASTLPTNRQSGSLQSTQRFLRVHLLISTITHPLVRLWQGHFVIPFTILVFYPFRSTSIVCLLYHCCPPAI